MKKIFFTIVVGLCLVSSASAQGTLQFLADMRAPIEVRPGETESTGHALFTLDANNLFTGYAEFTIMNYLSDLWIENGSGVRIAEPTSIISELPDGVMAPVDMVFAEWEFELTEEQTSQLMAGEFLIKAESTAIPPNYVTGQLVVVPEPGVLTILFLGGVFTCLLGCIYPKLNMKRFGVAEQVRRWIAMEQRHGQSF